MKKKLLIMGGALACLAGVGGIMAYFTDNDVADNNFTIGKIDIDLEEPTWDRLPDTDGDEVPDEHEDILPNETIAKDPQVKNTGVNAAFIFMEVKVPYANVVTANADGTKNAAADTELFSYTVNPGWVEVGEGTKNADGTVTHLYAYGSSTAMTSLAANATTPTLFDAVTFANVIEGQGLEESTKTINIKSYGIQTTNVNGGVTAPDAVWQVVNNQVNNPTPGTPD